MTAKRYFTDDSTLDNLDRLANLLRTVLNNERATLKNFSSQSLMYLMSASFMADEMLEIEKAKENK